MEAESSEATPCFSRLWLALILYSFCVATVAGNALVILAVVQVHIIIWIMGWIWMDMDVGSGPYYCCHC